MNKRQRELEQECELVTTGTGLSYNIDHTRAGHYKLTISNGQHSRFIVTSRSPSDWRANKNLRGALRQICKQLGA